MKRFLAGLLVLVLLLSACACRENDTLPSSLSENPPAEQNGVDSLTIAYNREDTLNPFAAKTELNVQLSNLLYETPVIIDENFTLKEALLAVKMPDPSRIITTVRAGAKFSDGTAVTAEDVRFSFEQAKSSETYATLLSNIVSVSVKGRDLTFTLAKADIHAVNNLIFPVIKRSTATTDAGKAPIGSGPYAYDAEKAALTANPHYGTSPTFATIGLKHMANETEVLQALENGSIGYMYSDLSGEIPRTLAKTSAVDLNRLTFLGVNGTKPLTADPAFRKALSAAINRTALAANSYTGRAVPATSPFHPKWKTATGVSITSANDNTAYAKQLLADALKNPVTAATTTAATGTTTTGTTATTAPAETALRNLTLIYVAGNTCRESAVKMLTSAIKDIGVTVTPTPLSYTDYIARLQSGDFDVYLGEIQLLPSMSLDVFLNGGTASYGIIAPKTAAAYNAWIRSEGEMQAFVAAFGEEMPFVPLCWRQGLAAYSHAFSSVTPLAFHPYNGISEWK